MSELTMAAQEAANNSAILEWGLQAIRAFQGSRPALLTAAAKVVTNLGSSAAYIVITAFMYWCVNERRAFRAGLTLFISNGINIGLKGWIREPRPYTLDPTINLAWEPTFSFPSGHSQNAAAFWPALLGTIPDTADAPKRSKGSRSHSRSAAAAFFALPFLIGLSRIYLGVHYPTDVLAGWAIGALIAAVSLLAVPRFINFLIETPLQPIAGLRTSYRNRAEVEPRTRTTLTLALAALGAVALNALGGDDTSMGGVLFGFAAGPTLFPVNFRAAEGTVIKKGARLAVGLLGLGLIYFGLKLLFPGEGSSLYRLARFARYGLCGFWASGLAPWLFVRTGLSRSGQ